IVSVVLVLLATLATCTLRTPMAFAARIWTPEGETESVLNLFYEGLNQFRAACGRFPEEKVEGLAAIFSKPSHLNCEKYSPLPAYQRPNSWPKISWKEKTGKLVPKDGWGKRLQYSSDGKSFRIDASHGYFVTDHSPTYGGLHVENPKLSPDPPGW